MEKHYVAFLSPGTFVAEQSVKEVPSWDIPLAMQMAADITERYGAKPFAFRFSTRSRADDEMNSREVASSPLHYLPHCKVRTIEELIAAGEPENSILLGNMRMNRWDRVVQTTEGWEWTMPFREQDVLLAEIRT